ncbi:MAG: SPRY domain-containing protein [Rudaea sp.]
MSTALPVAFDENAIGPSLVLTDGDFTLQTSAVVDAHRMARSAYGQNVTKSVVEMYVYSPNLATGLITVAPAISSVSNVPPICVGICDVSASLSDFVGHDAHGWGYCPGDGKVYNNNAVLYTWAAAGLSATITITFDFNTNTATFAANGTILGSIALTASTAYYYAATVSGNPGDLAVLANAGQTPLRYSPGGFYHAQIGINPIYIATEPYITAPTDTAPNFKFSGDLDRATTKLSIQRSLKFWPWGASAPPQLGTGGKLQFTILDPNEIYGELLSSDIRDQLIVFNRVAQGASFNSAETTYTAILDHCEQISDQTKTIFGNDKLTLLQGQLYRPLFPPDADKSVAGKPRPLSLGVCRTYAPSLYDAKNFYFGASSDPITAVGQTRMQGSQMALGIDYTELADAEGFSLPVAPAGKWTLETTTYGGAFNVSYTDQLGGNGVFGSVGTLGGGVTATSATSVTVATGSQTFTVGSSLHFNNGSQIEAQSRGTPGATMTGTVTSYSGTTLVINVTATTGSGAYTDWNIIGGVGQPTNWTAAGGYPTDNVNTIFQVANSAPNEVVRQYNKADAIYWMEYTPSGGFTLAAGATVAFQVVVNHVPYFGPGVDTNGNPVTISPAVLGFGSQAAAGVQFWAYGKFSVPRSGTYTGAITNTQSVALPLVFFFLCTSEIGSSSYLDIASIKIVPLPALTQTVNFATVPLDYMLQKLIGQYGALTLSDYDPATAQAIDKATGYSYGLHVGTNKSLSVQAAVKQVLDSCCADAYVQNNGLIGVARLVAPEDQVATATLTVTDFQGYLEPWPDLAENLTTRLSGAPQPNPYTEADFANQSQTTVPQSVRKLLEQPFQWTVVGGPVAPRYKSAVGASPLPSQLDQQADGQTEVNRVCGLYASPRNFYVGTVFTPLGTQYELGQIVNVTYPLATLSAGQNLMIVGLNEQPTEDITEVVFWGL